MSRNKLAIVGLVFVLVALAIFGRDQGPGDEYFAPVPTTYSSGPEGTRGLYLFLQAIGLTATRARSTYYGASSSDVLWSLAETRLSADQAREMAAFVQAGGAIVLPPKPAVELLKELGVDGVTVKTATGDAVAASGEKLVGGGALASLEGAPEPAERIVNAGAAAVVASYAVGKGHVISFSPIGILRNRHLRDVANATFVARFAAKLGKAHAFDEQRNGLGEDSLWALAKRVPYRFGLVQLLFALLCVAIVLGARVGPAAALVTVRRREAQAHVDAVAELWRRGSDAGLPLGALVRWLDQRAGAMKGSDGSSFINWVRWRRPQLVGEAAALRARAVALCEADHPDVNRVREVAAALREIEREVFRVR